MQAITWSKHIPNGFYRKWKPTKLRRTQYDKNPGIVFQQSKYTSAYSIAKKLPLKPKICILRTNILLSELLPLKMKMVNLISGLLFLGFILFDFSCCQK